MAGSDKQEKFQSQRIEEEVSSYYLEIADNDKGFALYLQQQARLREADQRD